MIDPVHTIVRPLALAATVGVVDEGLFKHGRYRVENEMMNDSVAEIRGKVKPYQIRQFVRLVERYNIGFGDEP